MGHTSGQGLGTEKYNVTKPGLTHWTKVMSDAIRGEFRLFVKRNQLREQWPILQHPKQFGLSQGFSNQYKLEIAPFRNEFLPIYSPPNASTFLTHGIISAVAGISPENTSPPEGRISHGNSSHTSRLETVDVSPTARLSAEEMPNPADHMPIRSGTFVISRQPGQLISTDPSPRVWPGRSPTGSNHSSEDDEDLPDYIDEDGNLVPPVDVSVCDPDKISWINNSDGSRWCLGKGTFGAVEGANMAMEDGRIVKVAVKKFYSDNETPFAMEARLQTLLKDTGVFPIFHGVVKLVEGPTTVICQVSELFAGGLTVRKLLVEHTRLREAGWVDVARQLTAGLQAIHEHKVIFNDLKDDNVLVDVSEDGRPVVKFIDLGIASFIEGKAFEFTEAQMDMYPHIAPEIKQGEETNFSSDIWSLGIIFARMAHQTEIDGLWVVANMGCKEKAEDRSSLEEISATLQSINPG